jgi:arylsulfatase A-like enzyme
MGMVLPGCQFVPARSQEKNKPNIVLITWHDLGDWLNCYGYQGIKSPFLDQLAREGVLLENYFATAPQCSPSRASLVTGLMPHSTGVMGLTHRGFDMDRQVVTLAQRLKQSGYSTHLAGIQHECRDWRWEGYQEQLTKTKVTREERTGQTVDDCITFFTREHQSPFFLAIGLFDVHRPYGNQYQPTTLNRVTLPPYLPDTPGAHTDLAVFYDFIERTDRQMGRLLAALECSGLKDNTIVIFTTDHGPAIPRAKLNLYGSGTKLAFLLRWPKKIAGGKRYRQLLCHLDVLPTLIELVGENPPKNIHGYSFAPLLLGNQYTRRRAVYAQQTWHCSYIPMRSIRTERYKYIINYRSGRPLPLERPGLSRYGFNAIETHFGHAAPKEELYDLKSDPHELCNIADNPNNAPIKLKLRNQLLDWMKQTKDPILKGPIPNPEPEKTLPDLWIMKDGRFIIDKEHEYWKQMNP